MYMPDNEFDAAAAAAAADWDMMGLGYFVGVYARVLGSIFHPGTRLVASD